MLPLLRASGEANISPAQINVRLPCEGIPSGFCRWSPHQRGAMKDFKQREFTADAA
jgi:hypothetical protein